jgi:hypothetical protein
MQPSLASPTRGGSSISQKSTASGSRSQAVRWALGNNALRKESKDLRAHQMRRERPVHDAVVFIGIAQEKAHAFSAHRLPGKRAVFEFARNKSVLPNYYYFYLDDADWGECFIKVCSYAPWGSEALSQRP